ncbi:hypothetical protein V6N11_009173 [Hibiscus sabdariffa]|uniref:Uncharacterized protein n=1 Tax=Hibiscus sabdariffa TaxID=183260 RepID=A0ABR2PPW7_9ROSI
MAPQLSDRALTNPRFASDSVALLSGLALGRLPEASSLIHVPISLECVDHPVNEEDVHVTKKSRCEGDEVMDVAGDDVMTCTSNGLGGDNGSIVGTEGIHRCAAE